MKAFKDADERRDYINGELDKVTALLDQLAEDTGEIFVALDADNFNDILRYGACVAQGIRDTAEVVQTRCARAGYVHDEQKGCWVRKEPPTSVRQEEHDGNAAD